MDVQIASISDFRANLASFADSEVEDEMPVVVTRAGKPNVALVSEAYLRALEETLHLLSNPANAARLLETKRESESGEAPHKSFTGEEWERFIASQDVGDE